MEFAASTIGTMLEMLKGEYTDTQIKKMLTRKKVSGMLKVINDKNKVALERCPHCMNFHHHHCGTQDA